MPTIPSATLPTLISASNLDELKAVKNAYAPIAEVEFMLLRSQEGSLSAYFHEAGDAPTFADALALTLANRYFFPTSLPLLEVLKKDFDEKFHEELAENIKFIVQNPFSAGELRLKAPAPEQGLKKRGPKM